MNKLITFANRLINKNITTTKFYFATAQSSSTTATVTKDTIPTHVNSQ